MALDGVGSAQLKIIRATVHLAALHACIAEYSSNDFCKVIVNPNGEYTLNVTRELPPEIAMLSGEIIYQIRSALDHLFYELVEKNHSKITLPNRWKKDCQFPLYTQPPVGITPPVSLADFPAKSKDWITARAFTEIEKLQPYYQEHALNRMLRVMCQLSNIDKHRHLNTTVALVEQRDKFTNAAGHEGTIARPFLDQGSEIKPLAFPSEVFPGAMHVERKLAPQIAFDEPEIGPKYACLVKQVLDPLPSLILTEIIPMFHDLISNP